MALGNFTSNQGTQTPIVVDTIGGGSVIAMQKLDISPIGAAGTPWLGGVTGTINNGSIVITNGTIGGLPNLPGGTLGSVIGIGSVSGLSNLPGGSIAITAGTIGTVSSLGTLPNLPQGSINVTAGTIGTVTNLGQVYNAGTLQAGTVNLGSTVKITPAASAGSFTAAGTITVAGSQLDFAAFDMQGTWVGTVFTEGQIGTSAWFAISYTTSLGVIGTSFTTNGDYFVSMAALDGVRARLTYSSGTLTYNTRQSNFFAPVHYNLGGSIGNIGTLGLGTIAGNLGTMGTLGLGTVQMTSGTLNVGTVVNNGGTIAQLTNGSIVVTAGTQSTGTLNTGTINTGTFRPDARTTQNMIGYGTQIANSGAAAGTIVGSASVGAGTSLWMNYLSIDNPNGTVLCVLGFGTAQQGTNVFWRGILGTQTVGGVILPFPRADNRGMTNQDLVFSTGAAGTVDVAIGYFISA